MQITEARAKTAYIDHNGGLHPLAHMSRGDAIAAIQELQLRYMRAPAATSAEAVFNLEEACYLGVRTDPMHHKLTSGRHEVRLTPKQFLLIARLLQACGKVVAYRQLAMAIWGEEDWDRAGNSATLKVMYSAVRKKLRLAGFQIDLRTQWGVGYFVADPDTV